MFEIILETKCSLHSNMDKIVTLWEMMFRAVSWFLCFYPMKNAVDYFLDVYHTVNPILNAAPGFLLLRTLSVQCGPLRPEQLDTNASWTCQTSQTSRTSQTSQLRVGWGHRHYGWRHLSQSWCSGHTEYWSAERNEWNTCTEMGLQLRGKEEDGLFFSFLKPNTLPVWGAHEISVCNDNFCSFV